MVRWTMSRRVSGRRRKRRSGAPAASAAGREATEVISHLHFREPDVDEAEDQHDDEQDHRRGAADADLRELQGALVDVDRGQARLPARTALGEEVDQAEDTDRADG